MGEVFIKRKIFSTPLCCKTCSIELNSFYKLRRRPVALKQSRALAHKRSLTDLHIACELPTSRDSGTDASQANAASAAGRAAERDSACARTS